LGSKALVPDVWGARADLAQVVSGTVDGFFLPSNLIGTLATHPSEAGAGRGVAITLPAFFTLGDDHSRLRRRCASREQDQGHEHR
jgi:hypothetical protein